MFVPANLKLGLQLNIFLITQSNAQQIAHTREQVCTRLGMSEHAKIHVV